MFGHYHHSGFSYVSETQIDSLCFMASNNFPINATPYVLQLETRPGNSMKVCFGWWQQQSQCDQIYYQWGEYTKYVLIYNDQRSSLDKFSEILSTKLVFLNIYTNKHSLWFFEILCLFSIRRFRRRKQSTVLLKPPVPWYIWKKLGALGQYRFGQILAHIDSTHSHTTNQICDF